MQMEREKNGLVPSTSIWEIAIKIKNNKLDLGVDLQKYVFSLKKSDVVTIAFLVLVRYTLSRLGSGL